MSKSLFIDSFQNESVKKSGKRKPSGKPNGEPTMKKLKNSASVAVVNDDSKAVIKKKRPWRNKVRKLAAKLAAQKERNVELDAKPKKRFDKAAAEAAEKRRFKRKARKQKFKLLKKQQASEESNENEKRLKAARFRFLNEQLYTVSGDEAKKLFENDPEAFQVYHDGFTNQAKKWPCNPINVLIQWLRQQSSKELVIADMGCGEAKIAEAMKGTAATVHSFDFVPLNDNVTACDMSKVPLEAKSVDVVIFCLSLMGTNLAKYFKEANRILKQNGTLKIAEVTSRFSSVKQFSIALSKMGFQLTEKAYLGNKYFLMLEFVKTGKVEQKRPLHLVLQPCFYKKR